MSVEQVKAFFAKVKEDSALAQKFKDANEAYKGDTSDKDAAIAAIIISVAAQAGFNFTVEDFKAAFDNFNEGEPSEEELKAVAGGGYNCSIPVTWCSDTAKAGMPYACETYYMYRENWG